MEMKREGVMPMEVGDGSRYPMIQMRWRKR